MFSVISTAEPVFYFSFNDFKFYNFHLAFFFNNFFAEIVYFYQ